MEPGSGMTSFSASMLPAKTWFALAGASLETAPGTYALDLTGETKAAKASSTKISFSRKFTVTRGKYPKIEVKLSVEGKFTEPTPEQQQQIADAQEIKKDYLNRITPVREWSGLSPRRPMPQFLMSSVRSAFSMARPRVLTSAWTSVSQRNARPPP